MAKRRLKKKKKGLRPKKEAKKKPALHFETKKGILVVICFALAILSILSFFSGAGLFGQYFLEISRLLFGLGFFLVPLGFILIGLAILAPRFNLSIRQQPSLSSGKPIYWAIFIGVFLFILSILGIFHIFDSGIGAIDIQEGDKISPGAGGYLGFFIGYPLMKYLGFWGSLIVLLAFLIIAVLITFNIPFKIPSKSAKDGKEGIEPILPEGKESLPLLEKEKRLGFWAKLKERLSREVGRGRERTLEGSSIAGEDRFLSREIHLEEKETVSSPLDSESSGAMADSISQVQPAKVKAIKSVSGFKLPPLDFLEKDKGQPTSGDIKANINIIKRTLDNFGIEVEMGEVNVGPSVTQYTLRPAQGIKLARITALQNDLALALAAHPLRIEAPIPGRSLVGIEIPNRSVVLVRLRNLLERPAFKESSFILPFALGRDVAGNPVFADLAQMPHLLVAGATGTGKTIALNNLIISLVYGNFPENLKFILIDPKRVELTVYNSIPYLLAPVVVQPDKAIGALRWAVSEMERRFGVLQEAGKRDINAYNRDRQQASSHKEGAISSERMPYIVIIIDELADLIASHGREVEAAIVRLAQMARAIGIHLVVSTQRPSVEVITGLIKANITSRMAFQVASQVDSRTILDMAGSEKLLGNGDMLFLAGNSAKPRRIQGSYISDKEIKRVTDHLREVEELDYDEGITLSQGFQAEAGLAFDSAGLEMSDELYDEAKKVVSQAGKASASLLQRRLRIGYARAARLLDILEGKGVVGPSDGAKPRKVFIDQGEDKEF